MDGDGRPDLLVAEPESGQLSVYLAAAGRLARRAQKIPEPGRRQPDCRGRLERRRPPEIFLLSRDENAVGVTQFDKNGRLPFPTPLPLDGKPLIDGRGRIQSRRQTHAGRDRGQGRRALAGHPHGGRQIPDAKIERQFQIEPATLAIQDVNQDGLADLVVLIPYEKVKVLLQKPAGNFDEEDVDPPGGAIEQPWLASADVDGDGKPELLLPQKNFVRAVVLEPRSQSARFHQSGRMGLPRERSDQRRRQRFTDRRRHRGAHSRHQRARRPSFCSTPSTSN